MLLVWFLTTVIAINTDTWSLGLFFVFITSCESSSTKLFCLLDRNLTNARAIEFHRLSHLVVYIWQVFLAAEYLPDISLMQYLLL